MFFLLNPNLLTIVLTLLCFVTVLELQDLLERHEGNVLMGHSEGQNK